MEYPWLLFSISNCFGGRNVCGTLSFSEEERGDSSKRVKGNKSGWGGGGYAFHSAVHFSCVTLH